MGFAEADEGGEMPLGGCAAGFHLGRADAPSSGPTGLLEMPVCCFRVCDALKVGLGQRKPFADVGSLRFLRRFRCCTCREEQRQKGFA